VRENSKLARPHEAIRKLHTVMLQVLHVYETGAVWYKDWVWGVYCQNN